MHDDEEQPQRNRRKGITVTANVALTVSFALVAQCLYVVFRVGQYVEKVDAIAFDIHDIKATTRDAARDIVGLQRISEVQDARLRGLESRVSQSGR